MHKMYKMSKGKSLFVNLLILPACLTLHKFPKENYLLRYVYSQREYKWCYFLLFFRVQGYVYYVRYYMNIKLTSDLLNIYNKVNNLLHLNVNVH